MADFVNDPPWWFFILMIGMFCFVAVLGIAMIVAIVMIVSRRSGSGR